MCFCGAELQWEYLSLAIPSPLSLCPPAGLFSFICISSLLVFLLSLLFFFLFYPYCLPAALPLFFSSRSIVNFWHLFQMYNIAIQIFVNYTSFKVITKYWYFLCYTDAPCSLSVGFPGSSAGKESACNEGDLGSIPGLGRSPEEGKGYPLQCSCLENSVDRGAWWATVRGVAESDTAELLSTAQHSLSVTYTAVWLSPPSLLLSAPTPLLVVTPHL